MIKRILILTLFLAVTATFAVDETSWTVEAVRSTAPIKLDGKLDEPAWQQAQPAKNFRQFRPDLNKPATKDTEVKIIYDDEYLYFGWICYVNDPKKLVTLAKYHDDDNSIDDNIDVYLDALNSRDSCYDIMLTPANVQFEGRIWHNGMSNSNEWDGYWRSATSIGNDCWMAEMAIPWCTIQYDDKASSFGVNFLRTYQEAQEGTFWGGTGMNLNSVTDGGLVTGLTNLPKPKPWQIIPYAKAKSEQIISADPEWETTPNAGLDAQFRLNSSNTISATYNPDYAHIEADEEQINLTPNELYLSEKRNFFLDGADGYASDYSTWYSRRITDIDYGGKVNGSVGSFYYGGLGTKLKKEDPSYPEDFFGAFNSGIRWGEGNDLKMVGTTREHESGYSRSLLAENRVNIWSHLETRVLGALCQNYHSDGLEASTDKKQDSASLALLGYRTENGFFAAGAGYMGKYWNVDTGYFEMNDPDTRLGLISIYYQWQVNQGILKSIMLNGEVEQRRFLNNEFKLDNYNPSITAAFAEHNQINYYLVNGTDSSYVPWGADVFHQNWNNLSIQHNVNTWWGASAGYHWGEFYGEERREYSGSLTLVPFKPLKLSGSLEYLMPQDLDMFGNEQPNSWAANQSIVITPLDALYVRLTGRQNTSNDHNFYSGLIGWTFQPGSTAYLAYNEDRSNPDKIVDNRVIFLKAGYMLLF